MFHYFGLPIEVLIEENGLAPTTLTLAKGRDGTWRGSWGVEFRLHTYRFDETQSMRQQGGAIPPGGSEDTPRIEAGAETGTQAGAEAPAANGDSASGEA